MPGASGEARVLAYGWLGSSPRQLLPYQRLLSAPGVRAEEPVTLPAATFFASRRGIDARGRQLADDALRCAGCAPRVGLFALSGNGATAVALLVRELRGRSDAAAGPCRITPGVLTAGFGTMLALRLGADPAALLARPGLRPAAERAAGRLLALGGRGALAEELYELLHLPVPHLLLYSRADAVIPYEHILRFAEEHREMGPVALEEFADSPHVSHLRRHPEQYARAVRVFLAKHLCDQ